LELFASTYLPAAVSPEVIAENQRTVEDQLASLRLLTPDASVPTALGHLLIGLDPTAWIPGAYIQFVRYEGVEVDSAVQDHEELRGNLIGTLDALNRLLPANIRTALTDAGDLRQRLVQPRQRKQFVLVAASRPAAIDPQQVTPDRAHRQALGGVGVPLGVV
jgi:ATP-dependent DNA helicase RecG